jgi:DNA-binding protein Fis
MKLVDTNDGSGESTIAEVVECPGAKTVLDTGIGDSLDRLVEYLVDNDVQDIHPFVMKEVEKRLIIKVLERSHGNKLKAAKRLGMSRNTFHRKISQLQCFSVTVNGSVES